MEVADFLRDLGLERYAEAFRDHDVDAAVLPKLTAEDLIALGITSVGHRRKLLDAIAALTTVPIEAEPSVARANPTSAAKFTRSEAERRQLTVLFCDLVGSTALAGRLDPEDMSEVIRAFQESGAEAIKRWDGHVAKYMGDGVLAYFGYPQAHEDDAERAVRAGLAITAAVAGLETPANEALSARVSIATGLVMVGELIGEGAAKEQTVVGETPNLAARLQGLAAPGQVVIAEGTRRLLGDVFDLSDLGKQSVKGIAEPVRAFAVSGERPVESRFEAMSGPVLLPMVGRDQELALLLERWAQAKAGEGHGVLLVGEAGIGKSRIGRALLDAITDEPHTRIRYQCSPYHTDSALWPVVQQLRHAAGLVGDDPTAAGLDKLEKLLAQAGGDAGQVAPLIADLIGLEYETRYGALDLAPQAQRSRTLEVLVEQLLGLAARQPVLVVLEDAHWIDPTTLELIQQGLDRIAATRVLILLTSRLDQQPELADHPHVTRLTINRLARSGVEAIMARLGGNKLPREIVDTIIARTDGVPLFVEEMTKAIIETGQVNVPASLHDSLMARIDRIPDVKRIAQAAACIGREFGYRLLAAISDSSDLDLQSGLARLTSVELVFQRGVPPDSQYIFKHALVRDAAYGSLLKQTARQIHRRIAAVLLDRAQDDANIPHDLVATHFLAAGRERDALPHMLAAAKMASGRYAYPEALIWLTRMQTALEQLDRDEQLRRLEMDLYVTLTPILMAVQGYADPKTVATAERAVQLCTELDDYDRLLPMLFGRLSAHSAASEIHSALEFAERIRGIGISRDNLIAKVVGYRTVGFCRLWMGHLEAASESLTYALELSGELPEGDYQRQFGQDPTITAKILLAYAKHLQGYMDTGALLAEDADQQAKLMKHPLTNAYVTMYRCYMAADRYEFGKLIEMSVSFDSICKEYSISQWEFLGSFYQTWVRIMSRERDASCRNLEVLLQQHRLRAFRLHMPNYLRMLATSLIRAGQFERAKNYLDEGSKIVAELGERWVEPELLRCKASLLRHQVAEHTLLAERCLRDSWRTAEMQGARIWQLRAARDLARLWADHGQRQRAHDILAPVYGWFTEGFDTADLKEAAALLRELG